MKRLNPKKRLNSCLPVLWLGMVLVGCGSASKRVPLDAEGADAQSDARPDAQWMDASADAAPDLPLIPGDGASDAVADAVGDSLSPDLGPAVDVGPPVLSYTIVDTGQNACYGTSAAIPCPAAAGAAFFGQDSQSDGNQRSYTVSASGLTVQDNVTGLTWQRSPDVDGDGSITAADKLTYPAATTRCAALAASSFAGFGDWRLPSIKELYSLIDFRGTDPSGLQGSDTSGLIPFIDDSTFVFAYGDTNAGERIIDSQYASSTLYVHKSASGSDMLFGVNFADGRIKGYDLKLPDGSIKTFTVQCVRGSGSYGQNDFVDNGDQTISDLATALMWSKDDSAVAMDWEAALDWVQSKNSGGYLGYNDWRLPNAKELQSIVDYTRSPDTTNSAAIDPIFNASSFLNDNGVTEYPWYWTSTTHLAHNGSAANAVYLAFGRAGGWQKLGPATCYSLNDVHGAGAQRSDPKVASGVVAIGTACTGGVAYGHGPQGDVQRAFNHVRLVRDGSTQTGGPDGGVADTGTSP